jgi:hypothetical protein
MKALTASLVMVLALLPALALAQSAPPTKCSGAPSPEIFRACLSILDKQKAAANKLHHAPPKPSTLQPGFGGHPPQINPKIG